MNKKQLARLEKKAEKIAAAEFIINHSNDKALIAQAKDVINTISSQIKSFEEFAVLDELIQKNLKKI